MGSLRAELGVLLPGAVETPDVSRGGDGTVVVTPGHAEEVATLMRRASEAGWPVAIGGGHDREGVVVRVSGERLGGVVAYEPADLTVTVGAGLRLGELDAVLREKGQWLPLDPPGWWSRSVGGVVSSGDAGPLRAAFGAPREHVLGATLVTGDGRVLALGGRVVKNVAGFDVLRLVVGGRGALGFISEVTLRVSPLPAVDRTLVWSPTDNAEAGALARRLALVPLPLSALEWIAPGTPGITDGAGGVPRGPAVAQRLQGGRAEVASVEARLRQAAGSVRVQALEGSASEGFFRELSSVEHSASPQLRATVLPARLPELVSRIESLVAEGEGEGWFLAHVTAGMVRFHAAGAPGLGGLAGVVDWVRSVGGSIRGAGVAPPGPVEGMEMLEEGLRRVFDPSGILRGGAE